jgi:hypothetical protein
MSRDSDLYGEDIQLWAEQQGALLRRVAAGEAVRLTGRMSSRRSSTAVVRATIRMKSHA